MRPHIWTGRFDKKEGNPKRCRAAVSVAAMGFMSHQCSRAPKVFREVDGKQYGFCAQHDPVAVAARAKAWNDKFNAKWDQRNANLERNAKNQAALAACKSALEEIANGHNDPCALARRTLKLFPEKTNV